MTALRSSLTALAATLTLLSCAAPSLAVAGGPEGADRERALEVLDRRLAQRRADYLAIQDAEAFRRTLNADLLAASRDKHLQVWLEPRSRDEVMQGPQPTFEQMTQMERRRGFDIRGLRRLPGNVAYLDLAAFNGHPEAGAAIDQAMGVLAGSDALILDLRRNGGGGEAALRRLLGHLAVEPMPMMTIHMRRCAPDPTDPEGCVQDGSRDDQVRFADRVEAPAFATQPIYVLTSAGSFSAAEQAAFDLRKAGRAVIVGERTDGGGNPSATMDLGPWFTVIMPIATTSHPQGGGWEGEGVAPDVAVPADEALKTAYRLALAAVPETTPDLGLRQAALADVERALDG